MLKGFTDSTFYAKLPDIEMEWSELIENRGILPTDTSMPLT